MDGSKAFLKGEATLQRGYQHFGAGIEIGSVAGCHFYVLHSRRSPSRAMASAGGLKRGDRNASMQWVIASIPSRPSA